jgi:hypothetical protein
MSAGYTLPPDGTLIELRDHIEALFDTYEGVTDPKVKAEVEAEIQAALEAEVRKVDRISFYIATCERNASGLKEEVARLNERRAMWERRSERVREFVKGFMLRTETQKLDGQTATFFLRAATPAVVISDEALVPDEFKQTTITVTVNKRAVKDAIEAGHVVPGADLSIGGQTLVRR